MTPCCCGHAMHDYECTECSCHISEPDDGSPTPASCLTVNRQNSAYTGRYAPQGGYSVE